MRRDDEGCDVIISCGGLI